MRVFIVAAFTDRPFTGNPAGVCIADTLLSDEGMQAIARELAQPETAFVVKKESGWDVRWFSPKIEVELCGHATLAAAHILCEEGIAPYATTIDFQSRKATLQAEVLDTGFVWLDFPGLPGIAEPAPDNVLASVNRNPIRAARHADRWLLEYETADDVRAVSPNFAALRATGIRSLIVTAPSDRSPYQIISRNFAPIVGVNEDQVTGMAHTCLAHHWRGRLGDELHCWQASQRGGEMLTLIKGERVKIGGRAITELCGYFVDRSF